MKIKMGDMDSESAGKLLRQMAELTANGSKNWENFEAIAIQLIRDAYAGGQKSAVNG